MLQEAGQDAGIWRVHNTPESQDLGSHRNRRKKGRMVLDMAPKIAVHLLCETLAHAALQGHPDIHSDHPNLL